MASADGTMRNFVTTFEPALNEALRTMMQTRPAEPTKFFAASAAAKLVGPQLIIQGAEQLGVATRVKESLANGAENGKLPVSSTEEENAYLDNIAGDIETLIAYSLESAAAAADRGAALTLAKSLLEQAQIPFVEAAPMPAAATSAPPPPPLNPVLEQAKQEAKRAAEQNGDNTRAEWYAEEYLGNLKLEEIIARALTQPLAELSADLTPAQRSAAELAYFRCLGEQMSSGKAGADLMGELLANSLKEMSEACSEAACDLVDRHATMSELSNKFAESGKLFFGSVGDFNAGLDATIGPPHPSLHEAMQREHTSPSLFDTATPFQASSYGITTTAEIEWWFVYDPEAGKAELVGRPGFEAGVYPDEPNLSIRKKRCMMSLHTYDVAVSEVNAELRALSVSPMRLEELIGARLYTGPMFQKYNGVMRGCGEGKPDWARAAFEHLCHGNTYSTTIHVVNSVIVKLGKLTHANKVYRGVSGRGLPKELMEPGEDGVTGGVDMAFLSTTRDRAVAMQYASNPGTDGKFGLVLEMQQGLVDRGADLSWLSQYPFEREILFAPLTALEVLATRIEGCVQVVVVRPTVNQKAQTIEQAIAKMQLAQMQLVDLLVDDLKRVGAPGRTLRPLAVLKTSHQLREASWFNEGSHIQKATNEAITARRESLRLLQQVATHDNANFDELAEELDASKMCLAAELFAVEADHDAALNLLLASLNARPHPRLTHHDVATVVDLSASLPDLAPAARDKHGGAPLATRVAWPDDIGGFECMLALQLLLRVFKASHPWPSCIVKLLAATRSTPGVLGGFVQLLEIHGMLAGPLAPSAPVLAEMGDKWESSWVDAVIVTPPPPGERDGSWMVRVGKEEPVASPHVLPVGEGGVGALLRAAVEQGEVEVVKVLLGANVSVLMADGRANTALHVAARQSTDAHALITEVLLAAAEEQGETIGLNLDAGFLFNMDGLRPYDLAMMSQNARLRLAIKPSNMDLELKEFLEAREAAGMPVFGPDGTMMAFLAPLNDGDAIINQPGEGGITYLMVASAYGQVDAAHHLLGMDADPYLRSTSGCSALTMAAQGGYMQVVSALIYSEVEPEKRKDLINQPENKNITALMRAAQNGYAKVVNLLLQHHADLQAVREDVQRDALILAARGGHIECCQMLCAAGASVAHVDVDGRSALANAAKYGHVGVVEVIGDVLRQAVGGRTLSSEEQLVYDTALAQAARYGHDTAVRKLVQRGGDPEHRDAEGRTPLIWACLRGHEAVIPNLLEAINDADQRDALNRTPLMLCAANGHLDAVHMLLQAKANLLAVDNAGKTALMHASSMGQEVLIPILTRVARDRNQSRLLDLQDTSGRTALMHATHAGKAVRALLQAGANRYHNDANGCTALMLAYDEKQHDTIYGFREAADALSLHRPPHLALTNKNNTPDADNSLQLGVGSLIVDVGTGEMKLMAALHFERAELHEMQIIKMDKKFDKTATSETIFTAGVGDPLDEEKMTPGFKVISGALREGMRKATEADWAERVVWMSLFVGVTAWYRNMDDAKKVKADGFLDALMVNLNAYKLELAEAKDKEELASMPANWECLTGDMEAQYEYKAVEYAMREQGRTPPIAIFAGGSGSVQVTGLDTFGSFPAALKPGIAMLKSHGTGTDEEVKAGIAALKTSVADACIETPLTNLVRKAAKAASPQEPVGIVLISAFFYAAVKAKLVDPKCKEVKRTSNIEYSAPEVIAAVTKVYSDATSEEALKDKDIDKERTNAVRLHSVLQKVFGDALQNVACSFARDWKLEGDTPFRTTWTAGWWLDQLVNEYRRETLPEVTLKKAERSQNSTPPPEQPPAP